MVAPGDIIAGKLRVERLLGRGGMGVVAIAHHLQLDQPVAVKVLHDHLATDPSTVERFLREARAAARLRSDHVCRVSDVGAQASGAPYIVMELLDGEDLAHAIARRPLTIPVAVDYVLQACVAIAEAHAAGLVHRDLKPANLFVSRRVDGTPLVKVLDFGIAKLTEGDDARMTSTATVIGSPGYMSPEQLRSSADVDARADVWALGVILYECVSGRLPFPGRSIAELAVSVALDPPLPLDADPAFVAIVARCLVKDRAARCASVAELAAALAPLGDARSQSYADVIVHLSAVRRGAAGAIPPAALGLDATVAPAAALALAATAATAATAAPAAALAFDATAAPAAALAFDATAAAPRTAPGTEPQPHGATFTPVVLSTSPARAGGRGRYILGGGAVAAAIIATFVLGRSTGGEQRSTEPPPAAVSAPATPAPAHAGATSPTTPSSPTREVATSATSPTTPSSPSREVATSANAGASVAALAPPPVTTDRAPARRAPATAAVTAPRARVQEAAPPGRDAAPRGSASSATPSAIAVELQARFDEHAWPDVIAAEPRARGDAAATELVERARKMYATEQTRRVGALISSQDCAGAMAAAREAQLVMPLPTPLASAQAFCNGKERQQPGNDSRSRLDACQRAFDTGDPAGPEICEAGARLWPLSTALAELAVKVDCKAHRRVPAMELLHHVTPERRAALAEYCASFGVANVGAEN